ncbi:nitrous oxide-stimulated promoter family protein [Vibrio nereis]|uniref:Nitrous oxide-stimulated promoter n=1 Tax=Vibrio nereis TaxID=693 RepID=A0A0M0HQ25_VIBNE|nr:nitrous oxide-stimulated promoter family protein [Vibrio nereis]KOO04230.1 nitrous oxide-stimulated promoter [Vibrio nereis]
MKHIHSNILSANLLTEHKTVCAMMSIYCRDHHGTKGNLCEECKELLAYAEVRLDRCPYGQDKPTCNKCPIHCYKPEPKVAMKAVMRYAGPRMLLPHPVLSARHLILERKAVPNKPPKNASNRALRLADKKD